MTIQPAVWDRDMGYPLIIYQGQSGITAPWTIKDQRGNIIDLTNCTARMMFREKYDSTTPFITLTTENGGLTLGGADGTITFNYSATDSAALTQRNGVWDLELISGGTVYRIAMGTMTLSLEATK